MQNPGARDLRRVANGFHFLEAPRWRDGALYFSDFYLRQVFVLRPGDRLEAICTVPHMPSGIGFLPDGSMLIVSMSDRRLLRLHDGALADYADLSKHASFFCNDMLVDAQGRAYVGNFGCDPATDPNLRPTHLLLVTPQREVREAAANLQFPNGIVLSPDGRTMLVAETFACRISAFNVAADGTLHNRRVWASLSARVHATLPEAIASHDPLPDGMALDAQGAVWMGDAGGTAALRVAAGGQVIDRVDTGDLAVYAVALGGEDRRTLYMCAAPPLGTSRPDLTKDGVLLSCRIDVPGAGLP